MTDEADPPIRYDVAAGVARIILNRPAARNAQSRVLLSELEKALDFAIDDPGVRVIVLCGAGDHFSAGHDLKEAQRERGHLSVEQRFAFESDYYMGVALRLRDAPKPTIAQVQGACVAAGFMLANVCDLIVASDDAYFSDPVCRTLGAAAVEVLVHPWALGMRRAKELLFTGDPISARDAATLGMVNQVVPRADLAAAVDALAHRIARTPAFTLQLVKRSLNRTEDIQGFRTALDAHFDTHQLSHASDAFTAARDAGLAASIQSARTA